MIDICLHLLDFCYHIIKPIITLMWKSVSANICTTRGVLLYLIILKCLQHTLSNWLTDSAEYKYLCIFWHQHHFFSPLAAVLRLWWPPFNFFIRVTLWPLMKSIIQFFMPTRCMTSCSVVFLLVRQELVKHTYDAAERSNLKIALDAMKVSARRWWWMLCNHSDFGSLQDNSSWSQWASATHS